MTKKEMYRQLCKMLEECNAADTEYRSGDLPPSYASGMFAKIAVCIDHLHYNAVNAYGWNGEWPQLGQYYAPHQLVKLSVEMDLDLGGYEWTNPPTSVEGVLTTVFWEEPDLEYLGLQDKHRNGDGRCAVFFSPHHADVPWPKTWWVAADDASDGRNQRWSRKVVGLFDASQHECHSCSGSGQVEVDDEYTTRVACDRCYGVGTLEQPPGAWAIYTLNE